MSNPRRCTPGVFLLTVTVVKTWCNHPCYLQDNLIFRVHAIARVFEIKEGTETGIIYFWQKRNTVWGENSLIFHTQSDSSLKYEMNKPMASIQETLPILSNLTRR